MAVSGSRRGRRRDAKLARKMILDAAEAIFAEHGFDGAHVDAIAKASGYNISLLFQYFGDKLGLYAAVLERLHRETTELQAQVFGPWLADEVLAAHRQALGAFLETAIQTVFDYLMAHPRFLRILTWEMAQGWQTYTQIASQFPTEESAQLEAFFQGAWKAGWLRSDCSALIQLTLVFQVCQSSLNFLPLFQVVLAFEDLSSEQALSRIREHIVRFIVAGMLSDPQISNA
jgi:TetR/AcrR family transcriptional regulator